MQKYEDYFKKLQFRLIGADRNNGCYRLSWSRRGV